MSSGILRLPLLSLLLISSPITAPPQPVSRDIEERIRRIEKGLLFPVAVKGEPITPMTLTDRMQFYTTPGVSIAFVDHQRVEWARAYGVRDAKSREPVTTDTLFQAGSISKPVAATIALEMVQRGRLSLDKNINEHLVSWKVPENEFTQEEKVTLRRILSHSAGLTNHAAGNYAAGAELPTLLQILDGAKPATTPPIRVDYVPGSRWRYSGGGYGVAQQLIVDTGGKPFHTIAQEIVFDRLQMKHSTFEQPLPQRFRQMAAVGHDRAGQVIPGNWIVFPEMAAAGLWSTPSDLARFGLELQRSKAGEPNRLLTPAMTEQMLARQIDDWGLGFTVEGAGRSARFGHGGDTEGFKCLMVMYQETGQGAVIMTNSDRGDRLADEILRSIASEYGWSDFQPEQKTVAKIDPKIYADYIGRYQFEFSPDYVLTISAEAGKLITELKQPTGQSRTEVYPESETSFFRKDVKVVVTFVKDESGQVTHLVFRQDGQEMRAKRLR